MIPSERLRILHIAPSFGVGGAEQMAGHLMVGLSSSHDVIGAGLYPAMNSSIESRGPGKNSGLSPETARI